MSTMLEVANGAPPAAGVTPSHMPLFNVRLSQAKIETILALIFPGSQLLKCEELRSGGMFNKSGGSYNNRVYFLEIKTERGDTAARHLVMKLSGNVYDHRKVQNEVGSLLLSRKFCPSIPVPQIVAWSEDGRSIETATGDAFSYDLLKTDRPDAIAKNGWIITTRVFGRRVSQQDLEGERLELILRQIAGYIVDWRQKIPNASAVGNLRFQEPADVDAAIPTLDLLRSKDTGPSRPFVVGGLLLCQQYSPAPLPTALSYYTDQANDQLGRLRNEHQLASLRARVGVQAQRFVDDLPRLSCFQPQSPYADVIKFAHMDLAPRNLLLSDAADGSPAQIMGLLDLEFAGFFPYNEEFINMQVRQPDDWTEREYTMLAGELTKLGFEVPHISGEFGDPICTKASRGQCSCDSKSFEALCLVAQIVDKLAPWHIREDFHDKDKLKVELDAAADKVLSAIERLQSFLT